MKATDKKLKLEERRTMKVVPDEKRVKITANVEGVKILALNVESLDADARLIVQSVLYQMLQRQKDELPTTGYKEAAKAEAAYAAATTRP
ncbi:putative UDP-N-acetylglucosamine--peptide N-acetylglucosaminyltransferase SPINDLY [Hordeum vulgare]|nr:putative UDP-N-acetylglucosamine--peptide N-acetylglucosaminyltransferase SPINDLY [Hordeum vulgare]KAI4988870.1 hypothetical protein ZWY2020_036187 [Hordeum vulgare]